VSALPPGQREVARPPRFGLPGFVDRVPEVPDDPVLRIDGAVRAPLDLRLAAIDLPRVEQTSDLHCVTSWTARGLRWRGWRLRDLLDALVEPTAEGEQLRIRGADGFRARLRLDDARADDVLLATHLDDAPLTLRHGAPLRLVTPAHYGYKSVKHVTKITLERADAPFRFGAPSWMEHPRGRVAYEERGGLPAWIFRHLFRPFIGPVSRRAERALTRRDRAARRRAISRASTGARG